MAHVELSLTDPGLPVPLDYDGDGAGMALGRWAAAVAAADDPCLLLDQRGVVVAASGACGRLFAFSSADAAGCHLLDGLLRLLDFTSASGELPDREVEKIPPLLVLSSGSLARGLLRVSSDEGATSTVDTISAPLRDGDRVVGSLTFFAVVSR